MPEAARIRGCLVALVGLLALTGCGKKGPLYLPDSRGDVVTAPPPSPGGDGDADSPPAVDSPPAPPNPAPEDESTRGRKEGAGTPPRR